MSDKPSNGDKELNYHLHVLLRSQEADADARFQAAETIMRKTMSSIGKLDGAFADFLRAYEQATDGKLKAELAQIMACQWPTRTEVQKLFCSVIETKDASPAVLQAFILSLELRIKKDAKLIFDPGIRQFLQKAHSLLSGKETEEDHDIEARTVILMKKAIYALDAQMRGQEAVDDSSIVFDRLAMQSSTRDGKTLRKNLLEYLGVEDYRLWIQKLRSLLKHAQRFTDARLALNAHAVLSIMEKSDRTETARVSAAINRQLIEGVLGVNTKPLLTTQEAHNFAEQIKEHGRPPAELLADFFEDGASVVLLRSITDEAITRLPNLMADMTGRTEISHLALHIPPQLQHVFERFLDGEDSIEVVSMLCGAGFIFLEDTYKHCKDERTKLRETLQQVRQLPGLQFTLVGTELSGELGLDEQVRYLTRLMREEPQAKVFMLSHPSFDFAFDSSRRHIESVDGMHFSYAPKLAEALGQKNVASVMALDEHDSFQEKESFTGKSDVGEFCSRHNITHSFGIRPAQTVLKKKKFKERSNLTYGEAWDGLVVFLKRDQDKRLRQEAPTPPASRVPVLSHS
ncbi:hypothetical protein HYW84_01905 [Candidatus Peregrinibacteria bacterium]|nr:hypothetical protein [Candidatus Peregrinibacteria bacterium]